jgi:hypothetical protein
VLAAVAVGVAMTGPGRFSLDRAFGIDDNVSGLWWGVGVACAALLLASSTLTLFRAPRTVQPA